MRFLPITFLKQKLKTKCFIALKCTCLGLQKTKSEVKQKCQGVATLQVDPVLKIDAPFPSRLDIYVSCEDLSYFHRFDTSC